MRLAAYLCALTIAAGSFGCAGAADFGDPDAASDGAETVGHSEEAFSTGIQYMPDPTRMYFDDSVPGIHIAMAVCKTTTARRTQVVECPGHTGYAMVAGGFRTLPQNGQPTPLVTESYPASPYYWHVRSQDHKAGTSTHHLEVYVLGIMLEGTTVDYLRKSYLNNNSFDASSLSQTKSFPNDNVFSGGFFFNANTFASVSRGTGSNGWTVTGREQTTSAPDFSRLYARTGGKVLIQSFGALDFSQQVGSPVNVGTGLATSSFSINGTTWAVAGMGAGTQTSTGPGRMLFALGSPATNARGHSASSLDPWGASTGTQSIYHTDIRKTANSHGICSIGTPLAASMDSCVANICANTPSCCSTSWSQACVDKVFSVCARNTCSANNLCTPSTFSPSAWSNAIDADCYTYAVNTFVGGQMGMNHWFETPATLADYNRALIGDGLLPSTKTATCPDGRTKVALLTVSASDPSDFHWVRKDTNGNWSQKWVSALPKQTDDSGAIIKDPETAGNMGGRKYVVRGYYCTCSDAAQGQGHISITTPAGEERPWPWGAEIPP